MGFDLLRSGHEKYKYFGINGAGWRSVLQLAQLYGWKPEGTLPPNGDGVDWSGTYFSNDGQEVTATDAAALADALERALPDIPDWRPEHKLQTYELHGSSPTAEPFRLSVVKEHEVLSLIEVFAGEREFLRSIVAFCRHGAFFIW